jgi:hypothetical protein
MCKSARGQSLWSVVLSMRRCDSAEAPSVVAEIKAAGQGQPCVCTLCNWLSAPGGAALEGTGREQTAVHTGEHGGRAVLCDASSVAAMVQRRESTAAHRSGAGGGRWRDNVDIAPLP